MVFDYERTAVANHGLAPLATFAGDEAVTPEVYAECITGRYSNVAHRIQAAAESLGLKVDPETAERWRRVCGVADRADTFLDESPDRRSAVKAFQDFMVAPHGGGKSLSFFPGSDELLWPSVVLLCNAIDSLPLEQQDNLTTAAHLIGTISLEKAVCKEPRKYGRLLDLEARLTALLLSESVSASVRRQPAFEAFSICTQQIMISAVRGDCALDLRRDYQANLTAVQPHLINSLRVAAGGLKNVRWLMHHRSYRAASRSAAAANPYFRRH